MPEIDSQSFGAFEKRTPEERKSDRKERARNLGKKLVDFSTILKKKVMLIINTHREKKNILVAADITFYNLENYHLCLKKRNLQNFPVYLSGNGDNIVKSSLFIINSFYGVKRRVQMYSVISDY